MNRDHAMDDARIRELVAIVAARGPDASEAGGELDALGAEVVPFLAAAYETTGKWQGRTTLVVYAMHYARVSDAAVALGRRALGDRATLVRYRACGLLAYSLRRDVLPDLRALLSHPDAPTRADAAAAIAAIESGDHNRFIDRANQGGITWRVNPGDDAYDDDTAVGRFTGFWRRFWRELKKG